MIVMPIMPRCLSWDFVFGLYCIFCFPLPPLPFPSPYIHTPAKWLLVVCTFCLHLVLITYTVYVDCIYVKAQAEVILTALGSCSCEGRAGRSRRQC